ncbi:MAG: Phosphoribosylformylglycinamidine synthase subunit PurL [Alphaproteobacteria bacterium MarineAlpha6_Bin3]|nr:MAG: Phosphoribosylformylglycinamidine synthase subunit PurL [Alphaproteobacteria bacterium MarineAlpha6_Bin3]
MDKLNNLKELLKVHNLSSIEYKEIIKILKREPNLLELGIFSVMWSEHCSYKSSKKWLKKLPTKSKIVICGPGENAGIIDIGNNDSIVFKIESHNHPSYLEPFQGAATGVGGILRDIFTMGARPIAILDSLRFGEIKQKKQKYLLSGVVSGISNYGNCMGIPTVGGECYFNKDYNKNILVNAMAVGLAKKNKLFFSKAAGIGNPVIYVGAKTGKDGIHGATMASAEFDDNSKQKKPTVQVGDPFTEKLVMEACLELMQTNTIVAIQDMGAAGLTCSSFEMAAKGNCGIELNINKIPLREKNMTPYEIMLSESQERMLIILKKGSEKKAKKIFDKWDLDMSVIGKITNSKKMVIRKDSKTIANIPIALTEKNTPEYNRPWIKPKKVKSLKKIIFPKKNKLKEVILKLLKSPNLTSKKWIWEQYDHMVMCDTIKPPSYGAAIIRVHGTEKSLAITTDCNSNYCKHDPFIGAEHAVSEARRNIISTGATPLAITNNLNFGNPEDKSIMGQFVMSVKGMINSCKKYSLPVISGNVSLYNETNGIGISPTPVIGMVGLIKNKNYADNMLLKENDKIYLIGKKTNNISCSNFLEIIYQKNNKNLGPPPKVNYNEEINNGNFVTSLFKNKLIKCCNDISSGGLITSLLKMLINKKFGAKIDKNFVNKNIGNETFYKLLFGENSGNYVVVTNNELEIKEAAKKNKVILTQVGIIKRNYLNINNEIIKFNEIKNNFENSLFNYI